MSVATTTGLRCTRIPLFKLSLQLRGEKRYPVPVTACVVERLHAAAPPHPEVCTHPVLVAATRSYVSH